MRTTPSVSLPPIPDFLDRRADKPAAEAASPPQEPRREPEKAVEVVAPPEAPAATYAAQIGTAWNRAKGSFFEAGRLLIEAKKNLDHGEFQAMFDTLPFSYKTGQRLMRIASDERLQDGHICPLLPSSYATIYEVATLSDEELQVAVYEGIVSPDMKQADVKTWKKGRIRQAKVEELAEATATASEALGARLYSVIVADPPWDFKTRSEKGKDRSAENHYPTMPTAELCPLPCPAANDAALFLWATGAMLLDAIKLMQSWGFEYKSQAVWVKDRIGTGYWLRSQHELLLIGTRGTFPAPLAGQQLASVIEAPVGLHSEKPAVVYEWIATQWPGLLRLEMFARSPRAGWDVHGNEAT